VLRSGRKFRFELHARDTTVSGVKFVRALSFRVRILGLVTAHLALSARPACADDELQSKELPSAPATESSAGPEFGVRTGYATPMGRVEPGASLRKSMAGAIPLWVDVGYRLNPEWFLGVYGHYGLGLASATSRSDCSGCQHTWVRFGVQAQRRWLLDTRSALWVGLGVGRESFNTIFDPRLSSSQSVTGWEWLNAQFGCEFLPTPGLSVGPYFSLSLDSYSDKTQRCTDDDCARSQRSVSTELNDSGLHSWVNAGLRVVFLP
jgi:hypothetical protein